MNTTLRILTFFIWIIFAASLLWTIIVLFWILIDFLLPQYLYMPDSISSSTSIFIFLFSWIIFVSIIFFYLFKRNRWNSNNHLELTANDSQTYLWSEIISSPTENNQLLKRKLLSVQELNNLSPSKLLSYGISLYNQGMINEAISIFRLIIERSDSSPLLVQIAEYRLNHLLPYTCAVGKIIVNESEDGELYESG